MASHTEPHNHGHEPNDAGHQHHHGLKGAILAIFAPHSHDAADSIDTALESSQRGIRAVKISFAALLVTSAFQLAVIIASGSVALLADTIHNAGQAVVWSGNQEQAELYWEQLRDFRLTMAPLETG